jgi:hypothetical protein
MSVHGKQFFLLLKINVFNFMALNEVIQEN